MTVRFLADEDIDSGIVEDLCSRESAIDVLDVKTAGLRGTTDPELLELAAEQNRVLITHDRKTMPQHVRTRLEAGKSTAGVFILPQNPSAIGEVVESLLLVWAASRAEEWQDRIVYLPFR